MAHLLCQILTGYCKARIIQILWYWLRNKQNGRESRNRLMYQYVYRSQQ